MAGSRICMKVGKRQADRLNDWWWEEGGGGGRWRALAKSIYSVPDRRPKSQNILSTPCILS